VSKRGSLRASDQDRDEVVDRLHKAATEGRIGADELEQRVSAALKARTYDELEATVADLPRPGHRSPSHSRSRARSTGSYALSLARDYPILVLLAVPVLAVTAAMLLAATLFWVSLMIVFLVVGGRRGMHRGPWVYANRYRTNYARRYSSRYQPRSRPHRGPSRRGPGGFWA
jgi:hypothetical protein